MFVGVGALRYGVDNGVPQLPQTYSESFDCWLIVPKNNRNWIKEIISLKMWTFVILKSCFLWSHFVLTLISLSVDLFYKSSVCNQTANCSSTCQLLILSPIDHPIANGLSNCQMHIQLPMGFQTVNCLSKFQLLIQLLIAYATVNY